jgi:hypothetical protein
MSEDALLARLAKAVSYVYRDDKTAPGVVVSELKKGYYCSVVRYSQAFAKGKQVVCNARGTDLPGTLKELANKFLVINPPQRDPVQELDAVAKKDSK